MRFQTEDQAVSAMLQMDQEKHMKYQGLRPLRERENIGVYFLQTFCKQKVVANTCTTYKGTGSKEATIKKLQ